MKDTINMVKEKLNPTGTTGTVTLRERLHHFTWAYVSRINILHGENTHLTLLSWFTLTMSTGGIALLLAVTPHTFPGLKTIGKIVFVFDLTLFLLLSTLILARFIMFPGTFTHSVYHPTESLFIPVCVSNGFLLLANKVFTSPRPSSSPYQPSYHASKSTGIPLAPGSL